MQAFSFLQRRHARLALLKNSVWKLVEHCFSMSPGMMGKLRATQHAGNFVYPLVITEAMNARVGQALANFFADKQVMMGLSGNLRLMGNAHDLHPVPQLA